VDNHIVRMANQIATFFASQPEKEQVEGVARHINAYWEPRMRRQLFDIVRAGGGGLHALVLSAAASIDDPDRERPGKSAAGGH